MATETRINGPTPGGGDYSIARFLRAGTPVDQDQADCVEVTEFSAEGLALARTYGEMGTDPVGPGGTR